MQLLTNSQISQFDKEHVWHPYSSLTDPLPTYQVIGAEGVRIKLADGSELIDGMASWWCMIHGYNHPVMNQALKNQVDSYAHVMFGGITHEPAVRLAKTLADITPAELDKVFFSDSGSVSVEVAIKMAIQYWQSTGSPSKHRLLTIRGGYHGDTFAAMSVCDPVTGMHQLFRDVLQQQLFAPQPGCHFHEPFNETHIAELARLIELHHHELAAVILEPVVQGAGGMYFYAPEYLKRVRELCDQFGLLLIVDEIATGFGRTGKLFACEWADISPDILCVGKALTGGYLSLAATLCTEKVSSGICQGNAGVFMHGPTFMGNPLACAAANTSIDLLFSSSWQSNVQRIESQMINELTPANKSPYVREVRVLGAIGVIEMKQPVNIATIQKAFVTRGVWIRPFDTRVYIMPPYIISTEDLSTLCQVMVETVTAHSFAH